MEPLMARLRQRMGLSFLSDPEVSNPVLYPLRRGSFSAAPTH